MSREEIESVRARIGQLDRELLARAAERVKLGRKVGELKRGRKLPTVDYGQERAVLDRARAVASEQGLDPDVAVDLCAVLIRASVSAQDEDNVRVAALGAGKTAVVIGGAGRMGRWFVRFLTAQGYETHALDPVAAPDENEVAERALARADLVLCATPPAATAKLYEEWRTHPPAGVIADIASIKSPLIGPIEALRDAGASVASLHPMFGPSVVLLRDADVVICDTGDAKATAVVRRLFEPTKAQVVPMSLTEHDRIMADLLSLAHASAIAFAVALPGIEHPVRSTTFQALESLAGRVVRESPDVYFEIQAKNPFSASAVARLRGALDQLMATVAADDPVGFGALLTEGQRRTR